MVLLCRWPSLMPHPHKNCKKGPFNDHLCTVWINYKFVVDEKRPF